MRLSKQQVPLISPPDKGDEGGVGVGMMIQRIFFFPPYQRGRGL